MIWGGFIGNKLDPIALVKGTVNQYVYIDVLHKILLQFIDGLTEVRFTDFIFQQDADSQYTAKNSDFLEKQYIKQVVH